MRKGEHTWFDSAGVATRVRGVTVIASASARADEKTMTSEVRLGEEFVVEGSFGDGKGKGGMEVRVARPQWPWVRASYGHMGTSKLLLSPLALGPSKLRLAPRVLGAGLSLARAVARPTSAEPHPSPRWP